MKDLGKLHHFSRITVEPRQSGLLLHQRQYALDILERAGMTYCKPCSIPVDTQANLSADMGAPVTDPTAFRSLVGALQSTLHIYLDTDTRYVNTPIHNFQKYRYGDTRIYILFIFNRNINKSTIQNNHLKGY
jgi:hypothetical protein